MPALSSFFLVVAFLSFLLPAIKDEVNSEKMFLKMLPRHMGV